jgi:ABC-type transporter Mla MlaB component
MAKAKSPKKALQEAADSAGNAESALHLENLEIKDIEAAKQQLLAAFAPGTPVKVDVARIFAIDTAGVQLLLAFQGEAAKRGIAVEFSGESAPLAHALSILGLRGRLRIASHRD